MAASLLRAWKKEKGGNTVVMLLAGLCISMLLLLGWQQRAGCRRAGAAGEPYVTHHRLAIQRQQEGGQSITLAQATDKAGAAGTPVSNAAANARLSSAPVDLRLAHRLLPLTNLSALTTAALLDASPGLSTSDARELMRLHQELYCRSRLHIPDPPNSARTQFSNVTMLVYSGDDIVSNVLRGVSRSWENGEVQEMLSVIRTPVPASPAELRTPSLWKRQPSPFVVDIGANLGWFALNAAAAGATVAAFEAMSSNVALIRASLCANPWLMERTALYGTGLGTKRSSCSIISDAANKGDGHTICDQDPATVIADWKRDTSRTYEVRGTMSVMRLDSLLDHDVQVAKLDVEGFEHQVLLGATGLLRTRNVWFILTECNAEFIKDSGQAAFLKFLDAEGYLVSNIGFKGPFLSSDMLQKGEKVTLSSVSLFLVKKSIHNAVVAASRAPGSTRGAWPLAAAGRRALLGSGGGGLDATTGAEAAAEAAAAAAWGAWLDSAGGAV